MDLGFRVLRSRAGGWSRSWGRISAATAGSTVIISITATTTVTTATTWWHHDGDSQHVHFTRNCKSLVTIATIIMWLRLKLLVLASWCRSAAREGATAEDADSPQQPESNDGGFVSLGRSATKRISLREAKGFSRLQRNLGEELLAKRSARAVLDTVAAVRLDAVTAATALCRLAKCPDAASVAEEVQSSRLVGFVDQFDARGLANSVWALAAIGLAHGPMLQRLTDRSLLLMDEFSAQGLSNTAWSLASLTVFDRPLLAAIAKGAILNAAELSHQDISNIAWAYARLAFHDKPLLEAIAVATVSSIHQFVPQDLANTAWSFATLQLRNKPALQAISGQCLLIMSEFAPQNLGNLAWALDLLDFQDIPVFHAISDASAVLDLDVQSLALLVDRGHLLPSHGILTGFLRHVAQNFAKLLEDLCRPTRSYQPADHPIDHATEMLRSMETGSAMAARRTLQNLDVCEPKERLELE